MFQIFRKTEHWHYGIGFEYGVDFAIWILEQDGLHVPPFDTHSSSTPDAGIMENLTGQPQSPPDDWHFPSTNYLQPVGLNRENWLVWFHRLILDSVEYKISLRTTPRPTGYLSFTDPAALYPGSEEMRSQLRQRYQDYQKSASNQRKASESSIASLHRGGKRGREVWRMMTSARGHLPPVEYFLVGYPSPIVHAVEPATVILSFGSHLPTETAYTQALLQGLQQLQL